MAAAERDMALRWQHGSGGAAAGRGLLLGGVAEERFVAAGHHRLPTAARTGAEHTRSDLRRCAASGRGAGAAVETSAAACLGARSAAPGGTIAGACNASDR